MLRSNSNDDDDDMGHGPKKNPLPGMRQYRIVVQRPLLILTR